MPTAGRALKVVIVPLTALVGVALVIGIATNSGSWAAASVDELREREVIFLEDHDIYLVYNEGNPLALSNDAQHVGDKVEFCPSSQMFESPAHGEMFDIRGNYYAGPAVRGLDRFPVRVRGNGVYVDVDQLIRGPERGAEQPREPEGRLCIAN